MVIGILLIIVEQYLVPTIANSLYPFTKASFHGRASADSPAGSLSCAMACTWPQHKSLSMVTCNVRLKHSRAIISWRHAARSFSAVQVAWPYMVERVLKLSLPTLYGWVFLFYLLFHIWLNLLAEVVRFGDREFYKVCLTALA